MNIASRRFYHSYGDYRDRRKSEAGIMSYFYLAWLQVRVLYSTLQYRRQRYALHSFEQLGALYMNNHDDKYPARPGFKPSTSGLQAPVYANEPSGPAHWGWSTSEKSVNHRMDWWSWGSIYIITYMAIILFVIGTQDWGLNKPQNSLSVHWTVRCRRLGYYQNVAADIDDEDMFT